MKLRLAVIAAASLLLAGCSDAGFSFDDILGFPDSTTADATPAQPAEGAVSQNGTPEAAAQPGSATVNTAAVVPPSAFCRGVATQAATEGAFDGPTQARVAQKSYAQCVAQFSAN